MNEFLLALWAMTASHPQWPMPRQEALAIVEPAGSTEPARVNQERELSGAQRRELRKALERMARCAAVPDAGGYVPEQTASCQSPQ